MDALLYPSLPLLRRDRWRQYLSAKSLPSEQLYQFLLGIRSGPAGVDHDPLPGGGLLPDNLQHLFFFWQDVVKTGFVAGMGDDMAVYGVDDIRLVIGLVRVDSEQIQIGRQQFFGRFPIRFHHRADFLFYILVSAIHAPRHINGNRNLLIVREVLAHVVQGEEGGVLQQEPGKHQGRYSGKLAGFGFALAGPAVGIVGGVGGFVGVLHHPVLCVKVLGAAVALTIFPHQTGHQAV